METFGLAQIALTKARAQNNWQRWTGLDQLRSFLGANQIRTEQELRPLGEQDGLEFKRLPPSIFIEWPIGVSLKSFLDVPVGFSMAKNKKGHGFHVSRVLWFPQKSSNQLSNQAGVWEPAGMWGPTLLLAAVFSICQSAQASSPLQLMAGEWEGHGTREDRDLQTTLPVTALVHSTFIAGPVQTLHSQNCLLASGYRPTPIEYVIRACQTSGCNSDLQFEILDSSGRLQSLGQWDGTHFRTSSQQALGTLQLVLESDLVFSPDQQESIYTEVVFANGKLRTQMKLTYVRGPAAASSCQAN